MEVASWLKVKAYHVYIHKYNLKKSNSNWKKPAKAMAKLEFFDG